MSTYVATVRWSRRSGDDFAKGGYSRAHQWAFDGGALVDASASSDNVPTGTADESAVDPEEAFVAAISSCHMLFFLDFARREGFIVDSYVDEATGILERNAEGRIAVTRVTLRPRIGFSGDRQPSSDELDDLHHRSHQHCFIANSVTSDVTVEPL